MPTPTRTVSWTTWSSPRGSTSQPRILVGIATFKFTLPLHCSIRTVLVLLAGFHLCVLIVHLSEHLPKEKRLQQFKTSPQVLPAAECVSAPYSISHVYAYVQCHVYHCKLAKRSTMYIMCVTMYCLAPVEYVNHWWWIYVCLVE